MESMEPRLTALEENSYFQQKRQDDLDQALLAQQAQLDRLAVKIREMSRQLAAIRDNLEGDETINTPPPHYNQQK